MNGYGDQYNKRTFLGRMESRLGRFAIQRLIVVVVVVMASVFIVDLFNLNIRLSDILRFDREKIFSGEVWRVLTFLFVPPDQRIIFIIFSLYFYWMIGTALERQWGSFRFDVFYLTGTLCALAGGFLTGYATNYYLNMSMFFAFALLFPELQVRLFFILPIKVKYIALVDAAFFIVMAILNPWQEKVAILLSVVNIVLFFHRDIISGIRRLVMRIRNRRR